MKTYYTSEKPHLIHHMVSKNTKTVEEIYQKKSQLEHILLRPDTYIGSIEHDSQQLWVYDRQEQKFAYRQIDYVPGLYKIFGK